MSDTARPVAEVGQVYLLHFERPFGHARHYRGWSRALPWRLAHHRNGTGARLLLHVGKAGGRWVVADVQPGTRADERRAKARGGASRTCSLCSGHRVACFGCGKTYRYPGWLRRHQTLTGCH